MKRIKCISFDFDDTLLLSEKCKASTFDLIAERYDGGPDILMCVPRDARDIAPGDPVPTRYTICHGLAAGLHARGVRPGPVGESAEEFGARLCAEFSLLVQARLCEADEVPGTEAMLRHLSAHGVVLHINSATPQQPLDLIVRARGWQDLFAGVHGATGSPTTKLDNLVAAADRLKLRPDEVVHVGDGENDNLAAAAFGCLFIGVHAENGSQRRFAAPVHELVVDMWGAGRVLCEMAGVPPIPMPNAALGGEGVER
jgi:phosphoglycolate phosphatase-like HAD superfamily hydrolase